MLRRYLWGFVALVTLAALTVLLFPVAGAMAQAVAAAQELSPEKITLPVGAWVEGSISIVGAIVVAAFGWLARKLPAGVADFYRTWRVEQLLERAISYGANAVAGAAKDKVLTVNVGNAVIAQAAQYAINHGAPTLIKWMGGGDAIKEKIIARLALEESAGVVSTAASGAVLTAKPGQ